MVKPMVNVATQVFVGGLGERDRLDGSQRNQPSPGLHWPGGNLPEDVRLCLVFFFHSITSDVVLCLCITWNCRLTVDDPMAVFRVP